MFLSLRRKPKFKPAPGSLPEALVALVLEKPEMCDQVVSFINALTQMMEVMVLMQRQLAQLAHEIQAAANERNGFDEESEPWRKSLEPDDEE